MTEGEFLTALPTLAFQAVLLLARVGACGMVLPGLGEADIPAPVRLGIVLSLVPLLLPGLATTLPAEPESMATVLRLVAGEVAIGLWLGWLARLVSMALVTAGQSIAFLIGLSSLLAPDQNMGAQGTATGRLMTLAAAVLVLSTGLYALPLRALVESYAMLPPGAPFAAGPAAESIAGAVSDSFALALRLAAPVLLLSLLVNVTSGLLARAAPQAQIFILAAPAQTMAGLALLATLFGSILAHWADAARDAFSNLPGLG